MENKIRIGIDPGKDGYIAIYTENKSINLSKYTFKPIPLIGKEVDFLKLSQVFDDLPRVGYDIHVVIEQVHAIFGSSAGNTFAFGYICGALEMLLVSKQLKYTKVQPKAWQKQMWQGINLQQKSSKSGKRQVTDTKSMSILAAQRLFPEIDLRDTERCKKPHDGKVDSLLLCAYGKRNF